MGFQGWNNVVNGGGVSYYPYLEGEDANLLFRLRFALAVLVYYSPIFRQCAPSALPLSRSQCAAAPRTTQHIL